jgi:hypothetical protein
VTLTSPAQQQHRHSAVLTPGRCSPTHCRRSGFLAADYCGGTDEVAFHEALRTFIRGHARIGDMFWRETLPLDNFLSMGKLRPVISTMTASGSEQNGRRSVEGISI